MASLQVQPDDIRRLVMQLVSMREALLDVAGSLRASRRELEATWLGGSAPAHIEAEMAGIERSIAENAEALDRIAEGLNRLRAAYLEADEAIRRTFDV